jgi:hypothetical protein
LLAAHFKHDTLAFGEFVRTFDLRVRGEDLLNRPGSGAWQPNHENRIGSGTPTPASAAKNCSVYTSIWLRMFVSMISGWSGSVNTSVPSLGDVIIGMPVQEKGVRPARALPYRLKHRSMLRTAR